MYIDRNSRSALAYANADIQWRWGLIKIIILSVHNTRNIIVLYINMSFTSHFIFSRRGGSNVYTQSMFLIKIRKISNFFY